VPSGVRERAVTSVAHNRTFDSAGNASGLTFLDDSAEAATDVKGLLRLDLGLARFRPALGGGKLMSPGRIEARYYFSY
jgi:hypothetical protein